MVLFENKNQTQTKRTTKQTQTKLIHNTEVFITEGRWTYTYNLYIIYTFTFFRNPWNSKKKTPKETWATALLP